MPVAQGACPNCGAPNEFEAGSSVSKVCPYCRHVILRTDRDWKNLGRAADLANTPSVVSVGDRGTVRGAQFEVLGRVQYDWGRGPWDEFYVRFGDGTWGWLTHAQGNVYLTQQAQEQFALPPPNSLFPDQPIALGRFGQFRVAERRHARVLSAEGELPSRPAEQRLYADLNGINGAFASIDFGDGTSAPRVFVGHQIPLAEFKMVPRGGEKTGAQKVKLASLSCPNCGGALPAPQPGIERVACRYCNAISELDGLKVIARQSAAYAQPKIPLGTSATLQGTKYTVIGYVERSSNDMGEHYRWFEYLLYGDNLGFRWLVDDNGTWLFVRGISSAEVSISPNVANWHGRAFRLRNRTRAKVDYVVGEFYWKVEAGETVDASDFVAGADVLSREEADGEVNWSYSQPVLWANIASAFKLSPAQSMPAMSNYGGTSNYDYDSDGGSGSSVGTWVALIIVCIIVVACIAAFDEDGGIFSGGGGFGGFGGK